MQPVEGRRRSSPSWQRRFAARPSLSTRDSRPLKLEPTGTARAVEMALHTVLAAMTKAFPSLFKFTRKDNERAESAGATHNSLQFQSSERNSYSLITAAPE